MARLFRNKGKYCGEGIDISAVLRDIEKGCLDSGWEKTPVLESQALGIAAYVRRVKLPRTKVYISSGMHGDEPAGPLALRQMVLDNRWPADVEIWMVPCLNPTAFPLNQRENSAGFDLNRDYKNTQQPEIRAHIAWLNHCPEFEFSVLIHEDWESDGYYLYELNPDRQVSMADSVIKAVRTVCPIQSDGVVDDWHASGGIIRPEVDPDERPAWPEAIYLTRTKSRLGYTLEAPSDFELRDRVEAHRMALRTMLGLS